MRVKLRSLTPIFIGGGKEYAFYPKVDYVVKDNYIYVIDQLKLFELLSKNEGLVDDYVKSIKEGKNVGDFINDLKNDGIITKDDVRGLIKGKIYFKSASGKNRDVKIERFVSSALGKYIPGSSVKGAIRTAVAYCYFKRKKLKTADVLNAVRHERKNPKFAYQNAGLQFKTFSARFTSSEKYDAKDDFLKLLRVRDSEPLAQDDFKIFQCYSFHLKREKSEPPMFLECLDEGKEVELDIRLFKGKSPLYNLASDFWEFLKGYERDAILKIFELLNEFAKDFIKHERGNHGTKIYNKIYDELERYINGKGNSALILLGKGTTFFGKTIDMVFSPEEFERM
ncbi:MAG: hypothetical protein XD52_1483, partial [bacterium 42_11]